MTDTSPSAPVSKKALWAGYILSGLVVVMLLVSAAFKFLKPPEILQEFSRLGYAESHALLIGTLEVGCVVIYAIPQTAVLGAILLTGYFGGATATHVRIDDPITNLIGPILFGVLAWLGLYLRDPRLRALIPLRSGGFQPPNEHG
jgi:hypothetical protein